MNSERPFPYSGATGVAVPRQAAYVAGVDGSGNLRGLSVASDGSLNVNLISGGGTGGTSSTDDAAFTVAVGSGTPMMGIVTADSVDNGDAGVVGMLANRQLKVTLYDSSGVELAVGGGTQYTEDAVSAANPVGNVPILVRRDTPTTEVSADGDNVAQHGTNYGAAYVTLLDTSGNAVSVGGGTQYTEDAAAAANPVGNVLNLVRDDARGGSLVSADGDNVSARGTNAGELYVKHVDTIPVTQSGTWNVGTVTTVATVTSITNVVHVDDNAGSLTVDNGGTFAVQATVAAGATNIAKAEDAASANADVGIPAMAIQSATPADTAGTDLDYAMLQMSGGRLWVDASGKTLTVGSHAVTNAGTFAVQAAIAVGTSGPAKAEDVASADGDVGMAAIAIQQSTPADTAGTNGDYAMLQMSAGRLWAAANIDKINAVTPLMGSGVMGTGSLRVTVASDNDPVTVKQATAANLNAAVVGTGTAGSPAGNILTVQGVASMTKLLVTPDSIALPANQSVNVSQVNTHTFLEGGTNGSTAVGGTVATNVAITANPLNLGAQAVSSENTAVTTARQVQLVADLVGKLIVLPYANPENFVSGAITSAMTGTTSTSLLAAPASGLRNYITQITVSNSHATVGTDILIQDGSGGTTLYVIPAAAVYGGATVTFPVPLRQPTTATAIFVANVTTGSSTKASASGYKGI